MIIGYKVTKKILK